MSLWWIWVLQLAVVLDVRAVPTYQLATGDFSHCKKLISRSNDTEVTVDASLMERAGNQMQTLIDCLPNADVFLLDVDKIYPPILIERPLSIISNREFTTLACENEDGSIQDRPFSIRSGDVTISKLKVDGCQRESTWGYIDAESPSYIGIRNVTLNDFHCINNVNTQGASCLSAWSVNGMEIKNMLATNNKGSIGGVLDMAHSKAIIMDSRFESNKAGFSGGVAHFHYSLNLTLQNVNFNSNSAAQGGGAILMQGGKNAQILKSRFVGNKAGGSGGAVSFISPVSDGHTTMIVDVNTTEFRDNSARIGGAIFVSSSTNLNLASVNFLENSADESGGAVGVKMPQFFEGKTTNLRIVNSLLKHNTAGGDEDFSRKKDASLSSTKTGGGAIFFEGPFGQLSCARTEFDSNTGAAGGAVLLENMESFSIFQSNFTSHKAIVGGAIAILNTQIQMAGSGVRFINNKAVKGGALYLEWPHTVGRDDILEQKRLLSSTVFPDSVITFKNAVFLKNWASLEGGAVDVLGFVMSCAHCKFMSNQAGQGGGMKIAESAAVVLSNSLMKACNAQHGGAIQIRDGLLLGKETDWIENQATSTGGAIDGEYTTGFSIGDAESVELIDCTFTENFAGSAGIVHIVKALVPLVRSRKRGKSADMSKSHTGPGSVVSTQHGETYPKMHILNTLFKNNKLERVGPIVFVMGRHNIRFCCGIGECYTGDTLTEAPCGVANRHPDANESRLVGTSATYIMVNSSEEYWRVTSGISMRGLFVELQDEFNLQSPQTGTLTITAPSEEVVVSGPPVTGMFISGHTEIEGLILSAVPGNYNLTMQIEFPDFGSPVLRRIVNVEVRKCTTGEFSTSEGKFCGSCFEGFYNFDPNATWCKSCPSKGASCPGKTIIPEDGWWHPGSHSPYMKMCLVEDACAYPDRGRRLSEASEEFEEHELIWRDEEYRLCEDAYTGVMCGSCSPGYGKSPSMTCEECPKWYILYPRLALAIIQMMITSLLFIKGANDYAKDTLSRGTLQRSQMINARSLEEYLHGHGMEEAFEENVNGLHQQRTLLDPTDILKILVDFLQVTSTAVSVNMQGKETVEPVLNSLDWVSGIATTSTYFAMSCTFEGPYRFIYANIVVVGVPCAIWAVICLYGYIQYRCKHRTLSKFVTHCLVAAMAVLDLSYIGLTNSTARIFSATSLQLWSGETSYVWVEDTSVEFFSFPHRILMGLLGLPVALLIILGFPIFVFVAIKHKQGSLHEEKIVSRLGFLYQSYRSKCAQWEVLIYLRKAVIAVLTISSYAMQPVLQAFLCLGTLVMSLGAQVHYQPFKEFVLNKMEDASIFVSISVYILGGLVQCYQGRKGVQMGLSVAMVSTQIVYVVYMLFAWGNSYWQVLHNWVIEQEEYQNHTGGLVSFCRVVMQVVQSRSEETLGEVQSKIATFVAGSGNVLGVDNSQGSKTADGEVHDSVGVGFPSFEGETSSTSEEQDII